MIFFIVLLLAAGMDLKTKTLDGRFLIASGFIGTAVGIFHGFYGRDFWDIILSCSIGMVILLISKITEGGIGEGDGYFFIVSGIFLNAQENLLLCLSGIFAGGIFGLMLTVAALVRGKTRVKSIPFLPFLLPGGLLLASAAK